MNSVQILHTTIARTAFILLLFVFFINCSTIGGFVRSKPDSVPVDTAPPVWTDGSIELGIDVLLNREIGHLAGKRVGLITNQSGVNHNFKSTTDILFQHEAVLLTALFAPEHGIRGDIPAGEPVAQYRDKLTGLPVYSLYGATRKPTPEMLADIDVLIFDMQDIGVRPYTYIYTMALAMEAARDAEIEFIVLDRPNPLGGELVEGNVLDPDFKSFIGLYPIPYVHGMTAGELAWMFNREFGIGIELRVIPMKGWRRTMVFRDTGLGWVPTSPHIPDLDTASYYAATGSIGELGTLSVGVGYTIPFRLVGAPWINPHSLAQKLNSRKIPGIIFRPMYWQQFYGIFKGQHIGGVELHITDQRLFNPFAAGIHILDAIGDLYPEQEIFPEDHASGFNRATGTNMIFSGLKAGVPADVIIDAYQESLNKFKQIRQNYLLY